MNCETTDGTPIIQSITRSTGSGSLGTIERSDREALAGSGQPLRSVDIWGYSADSDLSGLVSDTAPDQSSSEFCSWLANARHWNPKAGKRRQPEVIASILTRRCACSGFLTSTRLTSPLSPLDTSFCASFGRTKLTFVTPSGWIGVGLLCASWDTGEEYAHLLEGTRPCLDTFSAVSRVSQTQNDWRKRQTTCPTVTLFNHYEFPGDVLPPLEVCIVSRRDPNVPRSNPNQGPKGRYHNILRRLAGVCPGTERCEFSSYCHSKRCGGN